MTDVMTRPAPVPADAAAPRGRVLVTVLQWVVATALIVLYGLLVSPAEVHGRPPSVSGPP
jgi:hypothetical protein